jgi:hypothetical protein
MRGSASHGEMPPKQDEYDDYNADDLASPKTTSSIPRWVSTAETYASAEKRFVDRLIEANAGVIDLEMGLPASNPAPGGTKTAPRIDLVIAQTPFGESRCRSRSGKRNARPTPICGRVLTITKLMVSTMPAPR